MEVVFQVIAGNNPYTGYSVYRDVTNNEVLEYCGQNYKDLDRETQEEIQILFRY